MTMNINTRKPYIIIFKASITVERGQTTFKYNSGFDLLNDD